jgi:dynein heavy chain, axonemal
LSRLVKDFEPYKNLWITASDWIKWYDSWMNDPMHTIEADSIEKTVTEAYKAMHKAIKQFADAESKFI